MLQLKRKKNVEKCNNSFRTVEHMGSSLYLCPVTLSSNYEKSMLKHQIPVTKKKKKSTTKTKSDASDFIPFAPL